MNELMIVFGKAGYAYNETDCDDVDDAIDEFFNKMLAMNINIDNLRYTYAALRDVNGDDIEEKMGVY